MAGPLDSVRALWRATTGADRVVAVALVALSLALAAGARGPAGRAARAVVGVDGRDVATLDLGRPGRTVVEGRLGPVVLEVRDRAVRVVESGCPQRICVAMGEKRRTGEVLACVPNALVVRVEGPVADPSVPDAVTR